MAGCAMALSGCLGFGGGSSDSTPEHPAASACGHHGQTSLADAGEQPIIVSPADEYSSFQSKDPFVQQQVPTTAKTNTSSATTTPTSTHDDHDYVHQ